MPPKKKKGCASKTGKKLPLTTPGPLLDSSNAKRLILIRHGESEGQVAKMQGLDRQRDSSLIDCGLTRRGAGQASKIPTMLRSIVDSIDIVFTSPLLRALETTLRGFQQLAAPVIVHYGIREIGSRIPENRVRSVEAVYRDLARLNLAKLEDVDFETLKPEVWPDSGGESLDRASRNTNISNFLKYISDVRDERTIVVVCHYNVIRAVVGNVVRPENAMPIGCWLGEGGAVNLATDQREFFTPQSASAGARTSKGET